MFPLLFFSFLTMQKNIPFNIFLRYSHCYFCRRPFSEWDGWVIGDTHFKLFADVPKLFPRKVVQVLVCRQGV